MYVDKASNNFASGDKKCSGFETANQFEHLILKNFDQKNLNVLFECYAKHILTCSGQNVFIIELSNETSFSTLRANLATKQTVLSFIPFFSFRAFFREMGAYY